LSARGRVRLCSLSESGPRRASQQQNFAAGAGKLKKAADGTLRAVDKGQLSKEHAGELLVEARRRAEPDRPELADEAVAAIPASTT